MMGDEIFPVDSLETSDPDPVEHPSGSINARDEKAATPSARRRDESKEEYFIPLRH